MWSRNSLAHPTDKYIYCVVLVGLVLIFIPTCLYQMSASSEVRCWLPDHFTNARAAYAHRHCTRNMTDVGYLNSESTYGVPRNLHYPNPLAFLLAEAVLACVAFLLLKQITSSMAPYVHVLNTVIAAQGMGEGHCGSCADASETQLIPYESSGLAAGLLTQLAQSSSTILMYMVLQNLLGFLWFLLAVLAACLQYVPLENHDPAFLCAFNVMDHDAVDRHLVHCQAPDPTFLRWMVATNIALCVGTAFFIGLHFLHTTFLQVDHDQKCMRYLVDNLDIPNIKKLVCGPRYRFTDLYLASLMSHFYPASGFGPGPGSWSGSRSLPIYQKDKYSDSQMHPVQPYNGPQAVGVLQSKVRLQRSQTKHRPNENHEKKYPCDSSL